MVNQFDDIDPIMQLTATVNPYRNAASTVFERLRWDMNPISWSSRKKILKLRDKYKGRKVVILCNGPSLNKVDFSSLDNVFTIGLNKINLLFDRSNFRPSFIAAVNPLVIEQNSKFYNETEIPLFIDSFGTKYIKNRNNVHFLHRSRQQKFARDISVSLWQGNTVTFVAMQLAYHMGFDKVALVGCDHYFSNAVGSPNQLAVSSGRDESHFDPRYFSDGMKWHLPDLVSSEYAYSLANQVFTASGRRIYNATEGGALEIYPRLALNDFLTL